jgi:hypothetical protein
MSKELYPIFIRTKSKTKPNIDASSSSAVVVVDASSLHEIPSKIDSSIGQKGLIESNDEISFDVSKKLDVDEVLSPLVSPLVSPFESPLREPAQKKARLTVASSSDDDSSDDSDDEILISDSDEEDIVISAVEAGGSKRRYDPSCGKLEREPTLRLPIHLSADGSAALDAEIEQRRREYIKQGPSRRESYPIKWVGEKSMERHP